MAGSRSESFTSKLVDHKLIPRGPEEELSIQLALSRSREEAVRRQRSDSQRRESIESAQPEVVQSRARRARQREAAKALTAVDVGERESHSPMFRIMHGCERCNRLVVDVGSSQEGFVIDLTSTGTVRVTSSDEEECGMGRRVLDSRIFMPRLQTCATARRKMAAAVDNDDDDFMEPSIRKHEAPMSDDEIAAFKTAFILILMTKFLAPQTLLDNICPRYFMALKNLNDIPTWNWARYVVNDIISAARALANKLTDETKATYINGCVIFLQIFYLDNLELGPLNLKHDCFPRIMAYDQHAINVRLNMDLKEKNQYKPTQFGMMKLRPRCDVCYSRPTVGMKSAFRAESGAGPSEINPDNSKIVQQAFMKGHNLSDGNIDAADSRRSISPRSMSREIAASSCIILQDIYVENSQGELKHACGIKREYHEPKLLDFRLSTHDKPQRQSIKTLINSPFGNTAAVHSFREDVMNVLVNWVKNYQTEDESSSTWIAHVKPTPIKLTGTDIRNFIQGNDNVDYPTMSVYTRRLIELDFEMYGETDAYGKRHFIEPDFGVHAIAGGDCWNPELFRQQFTGPHLKYNVSKCENIHVSLCDIKHWSCYTFNLHERVIYILDSSKSAKSKDVSDWKEDVSKWAYKEPVVPTHRFEVESDIYTVEFMKNWNRTEVAKELNPASMDKVRTNILMDILTIRDNVAALLDFVKQLMRQYEDAVISKT
ncbi:hypothetical protein D1007_53414 [Hordeum vulgare]|nr:hypothetical protein D1007_53414 [Hordeum vulgare]